VSATNPRTVFEAYVTAVNSGDARALRDLVHPDFEDAYPQSRERIRGSANLQAIIEHYPGGGYEGGGTDRVVGAEDRWVPTPMFSVMRIEGTGSVFTGVSRVRYPDGTDWLVVNIAEIRDGLVWRVDTFFAPAFEPPTWRSQWVDIVGG
jgi:hypothetical protein